MSDARRDLRLRIAKILGRIPTEDQLDSVQKALDLGVEFERYMASVTMLSGQPPTAEVIEAFRALNQSDRTE